MNDYFGIGVGIEAVSALFELAAQFGKIVDFSVEDNPDGFVFVENRLMSTRQVDNAEPAHSQSNAVFDKYSFVVGTAMHDGFAHPVNSGVIRHMASVSVDDSRYAAHEGSPRRETDLGIVFVTAGFGAMQVFAGLRHRGAERHRLIAAAIATLVEVDPVRRPQNLLLFLFL